MSNFTPERKADRKNPRVVFSKLFFAVATILFVLVSFIYAIPLFSVVVILVVFAAIVAYIMVTIFTLFIPLLNESYRNLFMKLVNIRTGEELLSYYPTLSYYAFYALILIVVFYLVSLLLVIKDRKVQLPFFITDIIMLILSFVSFAVVLFFKVIN